jgi:purine nucleosidase
VPSPRPLIIDVDTGIDDALAILYACASEDLGEVELRAVTCVSGNVDARQVAENTRALLELVGRADVEVALGREIPLVRPIETTPETHGGRGIGYADLPPATTALSGRHAVDLILEEARRQPGEITLVTLGPLTNLAVAVLREPALPTLLRRWVLMGGAYRTPGNTTPMSEWNIHCDPEAARICFAGWSQAIDADPTVTRPLALGLDVTEGAPFTSEHMVALAHRAGSQPDERLAESDAPEARSVAGNPVVRFVADALRFYMEFHERYDGFYGAHIHDPLAVAAAIDPSLVSTQAVAVDVELTGELTAGATIADWRRLWHRTPNVDVAIRADNAGFLDRFVERVGGLAERLGSGTEPPGGRSDAKSLVAGPTNVAR